MRLISHQCSLTIFNLFYRVLDEESGRYFMVPQTCEQGEVAWRMTQSYVALRFWRPKPFRVCFSSNTPINYEKYSVFNASFGNMFVGSPNMCKFFNPRHFFRNNLQEN